MAVPELGGAKTWLPTIGPAISSLPASDSKVSLWFPAGKLSVRTSAVRIFCTPDDKTGEVGSDPIPKFGAANRIEKSIGMPFVAEKKSRLALAVVIGDVESLENR